MNQNDARNFIMALNNCAQYVPPMVMAQLTGNPMSKYIEAIANNGVVAPKEVSGGEVGATAPRVELEG